MNHLDRKLIEDMNCQVKLSVDSCCDWNLKEKVWLSVYSDVIRKGIIPGSIHTISDVIKKTMEDE